MQILVTNDDGIMAPGIQELAKKMATLADVIMVAPSEEKSAIGHGITIFEPIRVKKMSFTGIKQAWAVSGTPADCVKLAIKEFCSDCRLVISGINKGPNLGTDVLYSGTVSAAIEASIMGIPSLAISLASNESCDFSMAGDISLMLARYLYENQNSLPPRTLLNVNVPAVEKDKVQGVKITNLGIREYENDFDKRVDPRGNIYYWLAGKIVPHGYQDTNIDIVAVEQNYISVSPLHFDLTNYKIIEKVKEWGMELKDIEE